MSILPRTALCLSSFLPVNSVVHLFLLACRGNHLLLRTFRNAWGQVHPWRGMTSVSCGCLSGTTCLGASSRHQNCSGLNMNVDTVAATASLACIVQGLLTSRRLLSSVPLHGHHSYFANVG